MINWSCLLVKLHDNEGWSLDELHPWILQNLFYKISQQLCTTYLYTTMWGLGVTERVARNAHRLSTTWCTRSGSPGQNTFRSSMTLPPVKRERLLQNPSFSPVLVPTTQWASRCFCPRCKRRRALVEKDSACRLLLCPCFNLTLSSSQKSSRSACLRGGIKEGLDKKSPCLCCTGLW